MTIQTRLFLLFVGFALLLILTAGVVIVGGFAPVTGEIVELSDETEQLQGELERSLDSLGSVFNEQIKSEVGRYSEVFKVSIMRELAATAEIAAGVMLQYAPEQIGELFRDLRVRFGQRGLIGMARVDNGRMLYQGTGALSGLDSQLDRFGRERMSGADFMVRGPLIGVGAVHLFAGDGGRRQPLLSVTVSPAGEDQGSGSIVLFFSLQRFLAVDFGWEREAYVMHIVADGGGRIVEHSDPSLLGEPLVEHFPSQMENYIVRQELLPGQLYAYCYASRNPSAARLRMLDTLGQTVHSRSDRTRDLSGVIEAAIDRIKGNLQLTSIIFLLIAIAIGVYISMRVSRPLRVLTAQAKEVARGDLERPIDLADSVGGEIASLARNFERMRVALKQQIDNLDGLVDDRTRRLAQVNDSLLAAIEKAENASRAKTDFLAMMSHEIRTPMNSIIGFADILWENELPPLQRSCVEMVRSSSEILLQVINDILDFSKIEARQVEIEQIRFNLRDLVEEAARIIGPSGHEKGVEVIVDFDPHVEENVVGDPAHLRQILLNLLGNGVKFSSHGEVVLAVRKADSWYDFIVSDQGIGILPDKLESIFDPFTQSDSTISRRFGGTGLGLTICKRLSGLMGGDITVRPGEDGGSVFTVSLPFGRQQGASHEAPPASLAGQTVYIASDSETQARILAGYVEYWGGRAVTSREPDGVMQAGRQDHAAMVVDENLGGGRGVEIVETLLRESGVLPPVIFLAHALTGLDRGNCLESSGLHVCLKPCRKQCLERTLCADTARGASRSPAVELPQQDNDAPPVRILLAEDSSSNRELFELYLAGVNVTLDMVENGQLALDAYKRNEYDVVLMDMEMPVMDGYEASKAIREYELHTGKTPVRLYAVTAHAFEEYQDRCVAIGCDGYVTKPVKRAEFLRIIFD